ncbi:MAG TPA: outer membrane protein assembly factor BamC [Arenicellales bacterium]|nr:outer membrane protein assembly factor BamC [Arenicellales bacterium]
MTNMTRLLSRFLGLMILGALLAACGNTKEYRTIEPGQETERSRARLELPPDLAGTSSDRLQATTADQSAEPEEVLPETEGLTIERHDAEGWLEVEAPAEQVWRRLVAHWGALGVDLVVSDPKAGIMETDWVAPAKSEKEDDSFHTTLVKQFLGRLVDETTALDKYTITLERLDENRTRVDVAHRGIKKIQTQRATIATNAQWEWVETEEDPDKIRRALSSIVYGLENGAS